MTEVCATCHFLSATADSETCTMCQRQLVLQQNPLPTLAEAERYLRNRQ